MRRTALGMSGLARPPPIRLAPTLRCIFLPIALLASPALAAPASGVDPTDMLRELVTTVVALIAVCVLAYVSLRVMKRLRLGGGSGERNEPRFVRALPLGPRERLVVVEWRGETLLLGVASGAITVLDRGPLMAPLPTSPDLAIGPADLTRTLLARVFTRSPREPPS